MFSLQLLFYPNLGCYYGGAHEKSCLLKVYFIPLLFFFFSTFAFPLAKFPFPQPNISEEIHSSPYLKFVGILLQKHHPCKLSCKDGYYVEK